MEKSRNSFRGTAHSEFPCETVAVAVRVVVPFLAHFPGIRPKKH